VVVVIHSLSECGPSGDAGGESTGARCRRCTSLRFSFSSGADKLPRRRPANALRALLTRSLGWAAGRDGRCSTGGATDVAPRSEVIEDGREAGVDDAKGKGAAALEVRIARDSFGMLKFAFARSDLG